MLLPLVEGPGSPSQGRGQACGDPHRGQPLGWGATSELRASPLVLSYGHGVLVPGGFWDLPCAHGLSGVTVLLAHRLCPWDCAPVHGAGALPSAPGTVAALTAPGRTPLRTPCAPWSQLPSAVRLLQKSHQ